MPESEVQSLILDPQRETARLTALEATGILDTAPEACYDAITRLAAEYFQADTVLLGFADESRFWIKSYWGEAVRELPRNRSIFDLVYAEDGPVIVPDLARTLIFTLPASGSGGWTWAPLPACRCALREASSWARSPSLRASLGAE